MRPIRLTTNLPPGDVCTLTMAVESLHALYPGQFLTDVATPWPELWQGNPRITKLSDCDTIEMHYPSINRSNQEPISFQNGYAAYLGEQLGIPLRSVVNRPQLYLSAAEKKALPQVEGKFWIINAGIKADFTTKYYPHWQAVVDLTSDRIQWVQIGKDDLHEPLAGVVDLRNKTSLRQLVRLCHDAEGGVGPVTLLQHLCAAFEKPYVAIAGGREPRNWIQYPLQQTLSTVGCLPCCRSGACWRSKVTKDEGGRSCEMPVFDFARPAPKCMAMIPPSSVVAAIESYYLGGRF